MSCLHHGHAHGGDIDWDESVDASAAAHPQRAHRHDRLRHRDRPGGVVEGDEALEAIARFVRHAKPTTTAGYVKRLGRWPEAVAKRAAAILDDPVLPEGPT